MFHLWEIPPAELTHTFCTICEGRDRKFLFEEHEYPLWRCTSCGHAYFSPRPSDAWLKEYYANSYFPQAEDEKQWEGPLTEIYDATARAIAAAVPRRGDMLDVGCGYGGFLHRAAQDGWRVCGIEPSESAARAAIERLGPSARIEIGTFDSCQIEPGSFDCIVMLNVIEHVREPRATVRRALGMLRSGGILALRWPHMVSMHRVMSRLGMRPLPLGVPAHLHDFNSKSMETLFRYSGFTSVHHAWAGMQSPERLPPHKRIAFKVLREAARTVQTATSGKWRMPFGSNLTIGVKQTNRAGPEAP